jgi:hypothetical protein
MFCSKSSTLLGGDDNESSVAVVDVVAHCTTFWCEIRLLLALLNGDEEPNDGDGRNACTQDMVHEKQKMIARNEIFRTHD